MKFLIGKPATLISHLDYPFGLHYVGTTDMNGIIEVSDDDKYIDFLKANFTPIENDSILDNKTIGENIKSNTTPITGDKGDMPNVNNSKASCSTGTKSKRTRSTGSNAQRNSKNGSRRRTKSTKCR